MTINPLDRAPTLPPGIEAYTEAEMTEMIARHFMESLGIEADVALVRAETAMRRLFVLKLVEPWGVRDQQVTFVPSPNHSRTDPTVVYVLRRDA